MIPIEGVKLVELVAQAKEAERLRAIDDAKAKIITIFGAMSQAKGTVSRCEKDLEKAQQAVAKYEAQLIALESGNWGVLKAEDAREERRS